MVAINIVNFEFLSVGAFHTTFHLWEDTEKNLLLTDALEIHFVNMVKFRALEEKDIKNDPLHRWLTWFDPGSPLELVKEVIKMDKAIQKAEERVTYVSQDKEALRAYQMRQMALSDWTSGVNRAKREGKIETAREMKADNMPISQIVKYTGLTEQQIKEL